MIKTKFDKWKLCFKLLMDEWMTEWRTKWTYQWITSGMDGNKVSDMSDPDWQRCLNVSTCAFFQNLFLVLNMCRVGSENLPKGNLRWSTTHSYEGNKCISRCLLFLILILWSQFWLVYKPCWLNKSLSFD